MLSDARMHKTEPLLQKRWHNHSVIIHCYRLNRIGYNNTVQCERELAAKSITKLFTINIQYDEYISSSLSKIRKQFTDLLVSIELAFEIFKKI